MFIQLLVVILMLHFNIECSRFSKRGGSMRFYGFRRKKMLPHSYLLHPVNINSVQVNKIKYKKSCSNLIINIIANFLECRLVLGQITFRTLRDALRTY